MTTGQVGAVPSDHVPERPSLLDVKEVATLLKVSKSFVRTATNSGQLRAFRPSSQVLRYRLEDVHAYIRLHLR